tara:strand:- start:788 stop:1315 length:528 start_codon:yes stop_codon:yes gene_type:complete
MSSFEINKIMGSIFSVILLLLIIKNLSSILYPIQKVTEHNNVKSTKITNLDPDIDKEEINDDNIEVSIEERLISANISDGKQFAKKCVACHSFEIDGPNKIGPNLYNIHERQIASISTFKYSKALKSITDKWDNNNLDLFLKNPKKWAPGTKMSYVGIKKGEDRANLIKYLQSLK